MGRQSIHEKHFDYLDRARELREEACGGCGEVDGCTCEPNSNRKPDEIEDEGDPAEEDE